MRFVPQRIYQFHCSTHRCGECGDPQNMVDRTQNIVYADDDTCYRCMNEVFARTWDEQWTKRQEIFRPFPSVCWTNEMMRELKHKKPHIINKTKNNSDTYFFWFQSLRSKFFLFKSYNNNVGNVTFSAYQYHIALP